MTYETISQMYNYKLRVMSWNIGTLTFEHNYDPWWCKFCRELLLVLTRCTPMLHRFCIRLSREDTALVDPKIHSSVAQLSDFLCHNM